MTKQKQKRISTLVGVIIIVATAVILFGGVFAWQYLAKSNEINRNDNIVKNDETYNGKNNPYYDLGFGVEHEYKILLNEGDVKWAMPIKAVLSCDHEKITISGSINQTISSDLVDFYDGGEKVILDELVEPEGIEDNIFAKDYNFDGYDDLVIVYIRGNGVSAIETDLIFIYDEKDNKFVFQSDLSSLTNVSVQYSDKTIQQNFNLGYSQKTGGSLGFENISYKWYNNLLIKISDEKCNLVENKSSKSVLYYNNKIVIFAADGSKEAISDETRKLGGGSCLDNLNI